MLAVPAADEGHLIFFLPIQIVPRMPGTHLDRRVLFWRSPVRHVEFPNDEIVIRDRRSVAVGERVFVHGLERTPNVDECATFAKAEFDGGSDAVGGAVDVDFVEGAGQGQVILIG